MRTKNQIIEAKINFLSQVTEEELFNHFFIRHQKTMIKMCDTVLVRSKDRELLKFAGDILNIVDPYWFKGEDAIEKSKIKNSKKK